MYAAHTPRQRRNAPRSLVPESAPHPPLGSQAPQGRPKGKIFKVSHHRRRGPKSREEIMAAICGVPQSHTIVHQVQPQPQFHSGPLIPPITAHSPALLICAPALAPGCGITNPNLPRLPPYPQQRDTPMEPTGGSAWSRPMVAHTIHSGWSPPMEHRGDYVYWPTRQRGPPELPPNVVGVGGMPDHAHHQPDDEPVPTVRGRPHNKYGAIGTPIPKRGYYRIYLIDLVVPVSAATGDGGFREHELRFWLVWLIAVSLSASIRQ
ncbi:uncharacterized protein EI90DRAFT_3114638 [Cantharellus anzutake]|uniref:uncharacterized protein n=1 Tax=Cantharellus anzutake TaxID=1750568 RepID=UPI0019089EFC|nr:uncharacterized protein EI90DRAFT_3114638 [Cantharellus anzutake]KAF8344005.1 hypothetical protein EI90DRAFT_3114638 [Cantharellus anzutake]